MSGGGIGIWPWLAVAGAGALHGLNPCTGWALAAACGRRDRRLAWRALLPLALGHAASVGLVAALVAAGLAMDRLPWLAGAGFAGLLLRLGLARRGGPVGAGAWAAEIAARVEPAWGAKQGAVRSPGLPPGPAAQRRIAPHAGSTLRAGAICGAILRCRLVVGPHPTPRRRLDWPRNSPRRGPLSLPPTLLGLWSFSVATAHGSGLMLLPALLPLCLSASPAREITASGSLALALAAVGAHMTAMLGATALAAWAALIRSSGQSGRQIGD
ncbi:hypothetical protein [Pelomonas aquatica]|uniref:hypothetical protein n=3 Tax=Pelomonas aquatica TaxID=431058 RepID=UPI00227BC680|nr:hypothetical protein [Pelomonas aquatica]MCY4756327.1 hypothetical protein [Pelomonas aquatica]